MRAHEIHSTEVDTQHRGWALAGAVRSVDGKRLFKKGQRLDDAALERWGEVAPGMVHLIELEPGDLHEDDAGRMLAEIVAGPGLMIKGPALSRFHLVAEHKGLLRIDIDLLREVNRVDGATLYTLLDRQTVVPGKVVAGLKVTPIGFPSSGIEEVRQIVEDAGHSPVMLVPFQPKKVAVIATEGLSDKLRERFGAMVGKKMSWYGSEVIDVQFVEATADDVAKAFQAGLDMGADILMAAGGNTIDPLDPILIAVQDIGAEMIHFGAPAHPGSMFWLAQVGEVPIFNLASCSMYSRATVADLILPLVMTGKQVDSDDIIELGYGGVLEREMAFRFPDYDVDSSGEGDEPGEE